MKKEKSCGAVIYKIIDSKIYILLVKHNKGHWSFSKGHVENCETEVETAKREIKEETNLDVEIDTNFRCISTYSPKENIIKNVIYFVAISNNDDFKPQLEEISEIKWVCSSDAFNIITYEEDKKILKKAIKYIKENKISL